MLEIKKIIFAIAIAMAPRFANAMLWGPISESQGRAAGMIERAGDWGQLAIPISAAIYSAVIGDWNGAGQLAMSYGSTAAATYALKYTIREERPYEPEGAKGTTFPSGHTSSAFAGAGYWQRRYGWHIGAPMYAAAAFVGYSRVRTGWHNWLDVGTAAAIGIGFNYLFATRYAPDAQISVQPTDGGAYLSFIQRF